MEKKSNSRADCGVFKGESICNRKTIRDGLSRKCSSPSENPLHNSFIGLNVNLYFSIILIG